MRPVCAFSPCMPRPQRPGPSRAWRLWGRAFPHLIPAGCSPLPQRPAVGPHKLGRVGVEENARGVLGGAGWAGSSSLRLVTSLGPSAWVWEGSPGFSQAS